MDIAFPYILIAKSTGREHSVYTIKDLVDALILPNSPFTTIDSSQRDSVLYVACHKLHNVETERLRAIGETVCDNCHTHVMEQFMECSCACMSPPQDPIWIFKDGQKVRRTPLMCR